MRNVFFLLFYIPVFLFSQDKLYQEIQDECSLQILNPSLKNRESAKIRLHNGLKVLLISDDQADQSAAALSVGVGSWSDPIEYPGMAHFTEHMLFMGSKTYPNENEFWRVILDNAGKTNAYTSFDRTVFMFSIHHDSFDDALERFAHFFIDPLLHPSGVARELHAVDQEFAKNIENDNWRMYQISKEIGNQEHPNAQFSTGNSQTLSIIPNPELREWFEKNYSANTMNLVVYSHLPMDELKEKVALIFSKVPNHGTESLKVNHPLSSDQQRGKYIYIEPIKNTQKLYLEWEMDHSYLHEESKSIDLVAYALKRGQKSSLLEALRKEQLAENFNVGVERLGKYHVVFSMEFELTDQGASQIPTVITRTFQALEGMKQTGIPPYLFDEMKTMSRLDYAYQVREDAFQFVMEHGSTLMDEDLATYPQKSIEPTSYNPQLVQKILTELTPESCHYYVLAPSKKTGVIPTRKEKWLGGEYNLRNIEPASFKEWCQASYHPEIKIAEPSPFLPTQLKIVEEEITITKEPIRIVENEHGTVFYAKDDTFFTPDVTHLLHIYSPKLDGSAKASVLSDLYLKSLRQSLDPVLSCARASGLSASFSIDQGQFTIGIQGYSEKAHLLIEEVLKEMTHWEYNKKKFETNTAYLTKKYENMGRELPVFQAKELLNSVTTTGKPTSEEKSEVLESITFADFQIFQKELFASTYTEALLSGNLTLKDAESIWLDVRHLLSATEYPKEEHHQTKVLEFPDGPFMIKKRTPAQGNGVILVLDQGPFTLRSRAAQNILGAALQEAFFSTLRTKQQTAYIAKAWDEEVEKHLFQYFAVQSSSHQPLDLIYRFELFLEEFLQEMPYQFTQDRFETIKDNIVLTLQQLGTRNQAEKASLLNKLAFEYEDFYWIDSRIQGLRNLSYDEFLSYSNHFLSRANKKRLAILYEGKPLETSPFLYQQSTCDQITSAGKYIVSVKTSPLTSPAED